MEDPSASCVSIIPSIPDELSRRFLSLVPVSSHGNLKLVNKKWKDMIESEDFFMERDAANSLETWLFVLTRYPEVAWQGFSPVAGRWFRFPWLCPNTAFLAAAVDTRRIFVVGGQENDSLFESDSVEPSNQVWVFHLPSATWQQAPPMASPRSHPACAVIGRFLYVAGGFDKLRRPLRSAERMNLDTLSEWEQLPAMLYPESMVFGCGHQRLFWVRRKLGNTVQVYDPEQGTWSFREGHNCDLCIAGMLPRFESSCGSSTSLKRALFGSCAVPFQGKLAVVGGARPVFGDSGQDVESSNDFCLCDTGTGEVEDMPPMPWGRGTVFCSAVIHI